ncbi:MULTISPECIES: esterase/lipase family protein [unclassified Mesorhizobium]|uniref:esterase/lipase family protein n=1 Tax=unclassified Mesorhizobium TaxID=325217 RepID=UPI0013E0C680|nr:MULTISPECIES: hypothetical protein [unclassified Mesorhizobium]
MNTHVVFVHGLTGHFETTWQSRSSTPEFWPDWLTADHPNIAVWSIGYPSAATRWQRGGAMALPDRAANLLPLLVNEPKLATGNIVFVGHSLGGLVIEQLLRQAESEAPHKAGVASFLRRVRKVAFVGTPHRGSDQASLANRFRSLLRPRETVAGLGRNDPNLLGLNAWFRNFSAQHGIEAIVLQERRAFGWLGTIVKPDSADPGLSPSTSVIPLDEDHVSIVKPASRNSDVYRHLSHFVSQPPIGAHADTLIAERLDGLEETVRVAGASTGDALDRVLTGIASLAPPSVSGNAVLDDAVRLRVLDVRRGRYFGDFDLVGAARRLAHDLLQGELNQASKQERSRGLGWCARVLSTSAPAVEVEGLIEKARPLGDGPEITIASAFATVSNGDKEGALSQLGAITSPMARSASFIIAARDVSPSAALDWLNATGMSLSDMDGDGKLMVILKYLEAADWPSAISAASQLTEADYEETPALLRAKATTHLIQAVPDELRTAVLWLPPFHSGRFPLATDTMALAQRRAAQDLFERAAEKAKRLGCHDSRQVWEDMAIWLGLRDPDRADDARATLVSKLSTPGESLHYVPIALQFGFDLDRPTIRREIERQDALAGGKSRDAILAGFVLTLDDDDPREIAAYIKQNQSKLIDVIEGTWLDGMHVRALAASDQISEAEVLLAELNTKGLDKHQFESLQRSIDEAKGIDTISAREQEYQQSPTVDNLNNLVAVLQAKGDWPRLVDRAGELFERTHDLSSAHVYSRALVETRQDRSLVGFIDRFPELLAQSNFFPTTLAWALFRLGDCTRSSAVLADLRLKRDDENDRILLTNLAIVSGEWETLIPFVEAEWERRHDRSPEELLRAGQLGTQLGSPRAKGLVLEAAQRGDDDPKILLGCYGAAVQGDWEDDPVVHGWMEKATQLSGPDGPIQQVSFEEIAQRQPAWERRENNTAERLWSGNAPLFAAAQILNRTLVDLFLLPMLGNVMEGDVRRRVLIPAYSGSRGTLAIAPATLAVEPNALMTLSHHGLLDRTLDHFEKIYIPHSTLGWLFDETQRVEFHQPSRVTAARRLKQLLDSGHLQRFEASTQPDVGLVKDVGDDLASLIAVAESDHGDKRQRIVVRPYPVHRIDSLMRETVELADHASYICGCADLIAALRQRGQLTANEEERARSYLSVQERPWPHSTAIEPNAVLYLDELAVTYLQHLGILDRLKGAGFTAYVAAPELSEMDALIRHSAFTSDARSVLSNIRRQLAERLAAGTVILGEASQRDDQEINFRDHPTASLVRLGGVADAVLVDDRFMNQHPMLNEGGKLTPMISTLDLLDYFTSQGLLSARERLETRTSLRRAGYCLIPVEPQELRDGIAQAPVNDGRLVETAELRAIRENVLQIRMGSVLQIPKELPWVEGLFNSALEVLRAQWDDSIDDTMARARSDWLFELYDSRGWSHRLTSTAGDSLTLVRFRLQVWALLAGQQNQTPGARQRYLSWLDDKIFSSIRDTDPETYQWILSEVRELLDDVIQQDVADRGDDDH